MSLMKNFVHGNEADENNASSPVTTPGREKARVVDELEEKKHSSECWRTQPRNSGAE